MQILAVSMTEKLLLNPQHGACLGLAGPPHIGRVVDAKGTCKPVSRYRIHKVTGDLCVLAGRQTICEVRPKIPATCLSPLC